jgi:transcription initiation factor IIE alpha subunit
VLDVVNAKGHATVAELADALDLSDRRTRDVIASLRLHRLVMVTREQIRTQVSGLPVNGLIVWTAAALDDRDADRWSAGLQAQAIARSEQAALDYQSRCPCCGQQVPLKRTDRVRRAD